MDEITDAYFTICKSSEFIGELRRIRREFQGRPTPISHLKRLSDSLGSVQLYVKREDLNHTGAHKLNHCMGEALLAKYMGKRKVMAETGAGQHGVALATAAACFGLDCDIYMGAVDVKKQAPNVARMKILGARVIEVTDGLVTLKEAVDAAFDAYSREYRDCIYCIGSALGPHPFPAMVRDFQQVVGIEAREQFLGMTGELPDVVTACVGGGSNAAGFFSGFLADPVELVGVEPLGRGRTLGDHAASLTFGTEGVMHGFNSIMLKDGNGRPPSTQSPAGLIILPPAPNTPSGATWAASAMRRQMTMRPSTPSSPSHGWRASSPPLRAATPWPMPCAWPGSESAGRSSSTFPAAATRMSIMFWSATATGCRSLPANEPTVSTDKLYPCPINKAGLMSI